MPWKETVVLDERVRFALACQDELESMSVLCRRFGISRRTGYKWLQRYQQQGLAGLSDRSRARLTHPNQVGPDLREQIVLVRRSHPAWGPRKLLAVLEREHPLKAWPAVSTIGQILKSEGLSVPRPRRPRCVPGLNPLGPCLAPNRVWCADFKGWFRTGDGSRCDPLTITDGHSRYLLRCQATTTDYPSVRGLFEATFRRFGLPEAMRTDNGEPFASVGVMGLSRLSVWWVRLGIGLQRIEPGKPQQNGSHERMHGTLQRETASPPAANIPAQQRRFNTFTWEYNHHRPHEALGMATPASVYQHSQRAYPERLAELEYPCDWQLRKVDQDGDIRWKVARVFIGTALRAQTIGLRELGGRLWSVRFGPVDLGVLDERKGRLLRPHERKRLGC